MEKSIRKSKRRMSHTAAYLIGFLCSVVFLLPVAAVTVSSCMCGEELSAVYGSGVFRWIPYRITLGNYTELLLADQTYLFAFWTSMAVSVLSCGMHLLVSSVAAYLMRSVPFRGRRELLSLYTVLMLMPFQVTLLPTYLLSKRLGIYDTLWALILPDVFSPMGVFLIWEFMKSIPDETMEAAYLETDSNCRVLCSIVLPAVRPGIVTAGVLHFAESWNRIEQPLILLQSEWRYPLSLRLSLLSESTIGIRFAGSVLFMAPAVLLYFLLRDEITESIKFPAGTR